MRIFICPNHLFHVTTYYVYYLRYSSYYLLVFMLDKRMYIFLLQYDDNKLPSPTLPQPGQLSISDKYISQIDID